MLNEQDIIDMYVNQKCSPYVIADKYNTYPNKIRRILVKNNITLKNKSEAQKDALESGRSTHPTKNKPRSQTTKNKISDSIYSYWSKLSEEERQKRVDKARDQWNNMTEEERCQLRDAAAKAVRKAAKEGSKMEQFLADGLTKFGYSVQFHPTNLIPNVNLEIDLFIPEIKTIIEIDGPAHFMPIWGYENLQKHIKADAEKSGLLLYNGYVVIRVKHLTKSVSQKQQRLALERISQKLQNIRNKFPDKGNRYIELEVK